MPVVATVRVPGELLTDAMSAPASRLAFGLSRIIELWRR